MTEDLAKFELELTEGLKLSGQGSYERRMPTQRAMAHLLRARKGLQSLSESNPLSAEVWRLLSLAEESLLNYPEAEACLRKAMQLSSARDKLDRKKLARLREYKSKSKALALQPDQLASLGKYLQAGLSKSPCDHTLVLTSDWLKQSGLGNASAILNGLRRHGGFCDCEVLFNVAK